MPDDERQRQAWIIGAVGRNYERVFEAPVEIDGWQQRPWVKVRPLTAYEALQRESLGAYDEYHLDNDGNIQRVVRRYDRAAVTRYDYEHCLVDFCLPREDNEGEVVPYQPSPDKGIDTDYLLDNLPPALADWLDEALDEVNLRCLPDQSPTRQSRYGDGA